MAAPRFVHLRLHSEFSIVDGTVRVDDGIAAARADEMPALAVTDLANAFGLVKFYRAARSAGIKPIIGCDVWLTHEAERDQPFRALLLAQSRAGYLRLAEWLTRAYRTNQHRGRAELKSDWLVSDLGMRLIIMNADVSNPVTARLQVELLKDENRGR